MRTRARHYPHRRGLTLLEVMLAVVLLTMGALAITSTITFLARVQVGDQQRLGAYELANRLILQYLDDKKSLPSSALPQEYGGFRYRWTLDEDAMRMAVKANEATARSAAQLNMGRFKQINVRVWLVDELRSGNGMAAIPGEELAHLTRVYDPFGVMFRNPDSRTNFVNHNLDELINMFNNGGMGGAPALPPGVNLPTKPGANPKKGSP